MKTPSLQDCLIILFALVIGFLLHMVIFPCHCDTLISKPYTPNDSIKAHVNSLPDDSLGAKFHSAVQ